MKQTLASALENLVGRALSAVTFVADYVQLAFDGPSINAYTTPTVANESESLSLGQLGYRDALCAQIGCRVARTEVADQRVSVVFENGAAVTISLCEADYRGPEALEFRLDDQCTWVV